MLLHTLMAKSYGYNSHFLSRPRRFGNSLLVSTLEAVFEGKRELFRGLGGGHVGIRDKRSSCPDMFCRGGGNRVCAAAEVRLSSEL